MRALFLCLAAASATLALPATARGDNAARRKAEAELARTWAGDRSLLQLSKL